MPSVSITGTATGTYSTLGVVRNKKRITGIAAGTFTTRNGLRSNKKITGIAPIAFSVLGSVHAAVRITGVAQNFFTPLGSLHAGIHIKGTATGTFTTINSLGHSRRISGIASAAFTTRNGLHTPTMRITGFAFASFSTEGTLTRSSASFSLPEDRRSTLGYRPFTPLLVYVVGAMSVADAVAANLPDDGSFILSPVFLSDGDPSFYQRGGRANYVGTKHAGGYYFRAPLNKEIVWQINIDAQGRTAPGKFYKYDGTVWKPFMPYGYRAVVGQLQYVASQLDPSGAIRYYGQILGAIGAELGQDNLDLAAITDPDSTPSRYLLVMADELGVDITDLTDADDAEKRRRVRSAVSLHRNKGTIVSAVAAIREAGFVGYISEMWPNPTAVTNWTDWHTAPAIVQAFIIGNDLENVILPSSGVKGTDLILRPHNYDNSDPATYFPGSRVIVHVNNLDGTPLAQVQQSQKDRLYRRLRTYCLPAAVDIRDFVTDLSVGNDWFVLDDAVTLTELPGWRVFFGTDMDGGDPSNDYSPPGRLLTRVSPSVYTATGTTLAAGPSLTYTWTLTDLGGGEWDFKFAFTGGGTHSYLTTIGSIGAGRGVLPLGANQTVNPSHLQFQNWNEYDESPSGWMLCIYQSTGTSADYF